jgi:hypothetical protein
MGSALQLHETEIYYGITSHHLDSIIKSDLKLITASLYLHISEDGTNHIIDTPGVETVEAFLLLS